MTRRTSDTIPRGESSGDFEQRTGSLDPFAGAGSPLGSRCNGLGERQEA